MPGLCCYKEKFQYFNCPLWKTANGSRGEGRWPQAIQKQWVSPLCGGDQPAHPLLLPVHRLTQKTGRGVFPVTTGETRVPGFARCKNWGSGLDHMRTTESPMSGTCGHWMEGWVKERVGEIGQWETEESEEDEDWVCCDYVDGKAWEPGSHIGPCA